MANVPLLPDEIWLQIIDSLILPELQHLSSSCRRLHNLCSERLYALNNIKYQHWIERYNSSASHSCHELLLTILRGEVPASYIEEAYFVKKQQTLSEHENELLDRAVKTSPWIYEDEKEDYSKYIRDGGEDSALCVLLPMLSNLRKLFIVGNVERLPVIVGRIAVATAGCERDVGVKGPFRQLTCVCVERYGTSQGASLADLAPFAALRSLQRIHADTVSDHGFHVWPVGLPLSRVSEVNFKRSSIRKEKIRKFVQGFEGPCVMTQTWFPGAGKGFWHGIPYPRRPGWQYYEITGDVDLTTGRIKEGTRRETMKQETNCIVS